MTKARVTNVAARMVGARLSILLILALVLTDCGRRTADTPGPSSDRSGPEASADSPPLAGQIGPELEHRLLAYWRDHPLSPRAYVLAKFEHNDWVFLGEYHRIRHDVLLVSSLIPALHEQTRVRHLAMEFLCRNRTDEANRLITSANFTRRQAIDFFRDQFVSWSYEEYVDILLAAWQSNRRLARDRGPFQLVGLHPCPDYEVLNYGEDEAAAAVERDKQQRYDEIMADALEEALLSTGLPALIFTGIAHSTAKFPEYWVGSDDQLFRMGNLVYREPYRDRMHFIALHGPFYDSGTDRDIYPFDGVLDRLMLDYGRDIGFDVVGTPFADLRHRNPSPTSITAFSFGELYDGYVIHAEPLKETVGVTCIQDWIVSEEQYRDFWRNLANKDASIEFSEIPFEQFLQDHCAPRADHGVEFRRRFRNLPDLTSPEDSVSPDSGTGTVTSKAIRRPQRRARPRGDASAHPGLLPDDRSTRPM